MMPKISVRPLATRNSSSPYCTLFNTWIRKISRSTLRPRQDCAASSGAKPALLRRRESARHAFRDALTTHCAPASGIGERLRGQTDGLVLAVLDLAQVE